MQGTEGMVEGPLDGDADAMDISIQPNPANALVNVVLPPSDVLATIELFDGTGRMVGSWTAPAVEGPTNLVLDVSDRPEGMYMLRVTRAEESRVQRLVVAH